MNENVRYIRERAERVKAERAAGVHPAHHGHYEHQEVLALVAELDALEARPTVTCCARDRDGKLLDSVVLLGDKEAVDAVTGLKADREALLDVAAAAAEMLAAYDEWHFADTKSKMRRGRIRHEASREPLREALQRLEGERR